ncbi:MAG: phosphatase [Verrucomicrobia bacterium]|nr:MAG: phosphatase [Verrucomicrobiota bacterium]
MPALPRTVAVIDIGSNSIKLLVAAAAPDGGVLTLAHRTEETRIGTGITGNPPRLQPDPMRRAAASVQTLAAAAGPFEPVRTVVVATSAVRDAVNRNDFRDLIRTACGLELRVLTGEEEARYIARGILCDPGLAGTDAFYLFDLGGGSMELLAIDHAVPVALASLPLGCVRLTEKLVADPSRPLPSEAIAAVREEVAAVVGASGFAFSLPAGSPAVVTGGTATTFRAMQAAASGKPIEETAPTIAVADLAALAETLAAETIEQRRARPGLPPKRADVIPVALLTLAETARLAGVDTLRHSFFNLRYGLAAELLEQAEAAARPAED